TRKRPLYVQALHDPAALERASTYGNLNVYIGYFLSALAEENWPPDEAIQTAALLLTRTQWPDGHWSYEDNGRVPVRASEFTTPALAVNALQKYGPGEHPAVIEPCLARAKSWLRSQPAKTTDDQVFRLRGLVWTQASAEEVSQATARLLAEQRADG